MLWFKNASIDLINKKMRFVNNFECFLMWRVVGGLLRIISQVSIKKLSQIDNYTWNKDVGMDETIFGDFQDPRKNKSRSEFFGGSLERILFFQKKTPTTSFLALFLQQLGIFCENNLIFHFSKALFIICKNKNVFLFWLSHIRMKLKSEASNKLGTTFVSRKILCSKILKLF